MHGMQYCMIILVSLVLHSTHYLLFPFSVFSYSWQHSLSVSLSHLIVHSLPTFITYHSCEMGGSAGAFWHRHWKRSWLSHASTRFCKNITGKGWYCAKAMGAAYTCTSIKSWSGHTFPLVNNKSIMDPSTPPPHSNQTFLIWFQSPCWKTKKNFNFEVQGQPGSISKDDGSKPAPSTCGGNGTWMEGTSSQ